MLTTIAGFLAFTLFVIIYSWYKLRHEKFDTSDGYFLAGKSLTGPIIAGSMLLTNISTEHLIGMNGNAYKNGIIVIAWEVTSAVALVIAAIYFIPKYFKIGIKTIPELLEKRFDSLTSTLVAIFLMISFTVTVLPIVLYTGAINLESIFDISAIFHISKSAGLWYAVLTIGIIGSIYAVFGGLKAVAYSDYLNGFGLLAGGLFIPYLALKSIGDGNVALGLQTVYKHAPEKFDIIGKPDSVLPFSTLFTGLMINQLYFWGMNQTIIQRAFGAKNLIEAQKGLIYTGVLKLLVPLLIVLPGLIAYYYYGDTYYNSQDSVYPLLVKKVLPPVFTGLFAAIILGAVLSTFNSVLNSAGTIFCYDLYAKHFKKNASDKELVRVGKLVSIILAIFAIFSAPFVANAPEGLYQLLQQLNGIFFIPIASIMFAALFVKSINATGAKAGLIFGLIFYLLTTFIFDTGLHFVHIWGIEFVLNFIIMLIISKISNTTEKPLVHQQATTTSWSLVKPFGLALCFITLLIYYLLS